MNDATREASRYLLNELASTDLSSALVCLVGEMARFKTGGDKFFTVAEYLCRGMPHDYRETIKKALCGSIEEAEFDTSEAFRRVRGVQVVLWVGVLWARSLHVYDGNDHPGLKRYAEMLDVHPIPTKHIVDEPFQDGMKSGCSYYGGRQ